MSRRKMECIQCGARVRDADAMRSHFESQHTHDQRKEFATIMAEIVGDLPDGAWFQALTDLGVDPCWLAEEEI